MTEAALRVALVERLAACDEPELQLLHVALVRIENRRVQRPVIAGLRELRAACAPPCGEWHDVDRDPHTGSCAQCARLGLPPEAPRA